MNLYVWHFNGAKEYCEQLFKNLLGIREGSVENEDLCVILKRYAQRDFYNLAFPQPGDTKARWGFVRY